MKYLAILKDSLREALDSKVLYVTLALSAVIVVLIGSVSYRPVPVEEQLIRMTGIMNWAMSLNPQLQPPRYSIADFEQTNKATEPWKGEYRFDYVQEFPSEQSLKFAKDNGLFFSRDQIQQQFKGPFHWVEKLTVADVDTGKPLEFRYHVATKGSKLDDRREWVHEPRLFFGAVPIAILQMPLAALVNFIADKLIGTFGAAVTMLLSIIITAFFVPNMLRKGTIDLLLAKPIHRTTLLVYKFIGGMAFMFLNTIVIVTGLWFVLGLQTGVWLNGFLLCVFVFTFQFAIFYSVSTLMAVLTRSPVVSILVCVFTWVVLVGVGWGYQYVDSVRPEKLKNAPQEQMGRLADWIYPTVGAIHFVLPHYKDLDALTTKLIDKNLRPEEADQSKRLEDRVDSINWPESLISTTAFIALVLGLACWRFAVKDY